MPLTQPLAAYAHIRKAGGLYYIAGQGCRDAKTNNYAGVTRDPSGQISKYDIVAQTRAVLENVERVLQSEGMDRRHVIDVSVFLSSMGDFKGMNDVWNEFFGELTEKPTRTTVAVKQLPGDNFVEMKAIAAKD